MAVDKKLELDKVQLNHAGDVSVEVMGQGPGLVLLHGWGLNSAVWHTMTTALSQSHTLYLVDLPGYGHSRGLQLPADLSVWSRHVVEAIPEPAAWLGWSLGGLIATQAAIDYPHRITQLITVASSPKFVAEGKWRGIAPDVLELFQQQLATDFRQTLGRFLAIQAMGSDSARLDVKRLKQVVSDRPEPDLEALAIGLELLASCDLRDELQHIRQPFLRLYGRLDSLVPRKAIGHIDGLSPNSHTTILDKAAHAPFISHPEAFVDALITFLCSEKSD